MSPMVLRTKGPAKLPDGYKLTLHISQSDAESVRIFRAKSGEGDNVILCEYGWRLHLVNVCVGHLSCSFSI